MRGLNLLAGLCLAVAACAPAGATPYTPLHWQRLVEQHADPVFVGQRKHTTWIRDQNRNFIDDDIERRFKSGDVVDVVLALNACATPALLESLARFGRVRHVGKLVTAVYLDKVKFDDLRRLAQRPEVAMVEWQQRVVPEIDVASRATEARTSPAYQAIEQSAEALGLTGAGVNIAFVGQGIDDGTTATHPWLALPAGRFVAGVDVTDSTDPQDGTRNPSDAGWKLFPSGAVLPGHETTMAMLALGSGVSSATGSCRYSGAGANCRGIASQAGIVDVRYCSRSGPDTAPVVTCSSSDTAAALDWVGTHARTPQFSIHVAVLAFSVCGADDGTSVLAQQVNHLAAVGVVPVASFPSVGNENAGCRAPGDPQAVPGDHLVKSPAAASYAISVNGSDDKNTVSRADETIWASHLDGPRADFNLISPNLLALKPDITAAATNVSTAVSSGIGGTSPSAAIVGGLAALILQQVPTMTPDDVKELLRSSADSSRNLAPFDPATGVWQTDLGWGLANVGRALALAASRRTNVKFPTCQTPSTAGNGNPCSLSNGDPNWLNTQDITTSTPPQVGVPTTVTAMVRNDGNFPARVRVHFGNYTFGVGAAQFHDLGTQEVLIDPHTSVPVSMPWTPGPVDHECIQVSIAYGEDVDYSDNLTQRNFAVKPSLFDVRVENRYGVPTEFDVVATSRRKGWDCLPKHLSFTLEPFTGCARNVRIGFEAPPGTPQGEEARCDVAVYATPRGGERQLAGGVSLGTYVPRQCRVAGLVIDGKGRPVRGARVDFVRPSTHKEEKTGAETLPPSKQRPVETRTARDGTFVVTLTPDVVQQMSVKAALGAGSVRLRPTCGGLGRIVVHEKGIEMLPVVPRFVDADGASVAGGSLEWSKAATPSCERAEGTEQGRRAVDEPAPPPAPPSRS
jgi:hypothetical protein